MSDSVTQITNPKDILKSVFGYSDFRDAQGDIIEAAISKRDTLVIMPTGGGKSLCFQIPALAQDGLTLVISPLIALMADQVQALQANNIEAAFVNSTQTVVEKKIVLDKIESGELKLLYISPEKAMTGPFLRYIAQKKIELIAIDEAHCVSVWGNDFRPEYAKLKELVHLLPNTPVMALTATADKATQKDIIKQLGLRDPKRFLSSFERKNIHVSVQPAQGRLQQIYAFLKAHADEAGIVYCLSRKSTMEMAEKLRAAGYRAAHYHAEISTADKKKVQEGFQKDDIQIICATIAFGMGIDKSNIRWIIHYNLPKNIESYYQEIGRAGRDGTNAEALLFYSYFDINIFKKFIDESTADETFKTVQHSKLQRIWEFTQATNCRTNLVLNYFGEYRVESCGHCDNCLHPPVGFDGTDMAQKALTVCKEGQEKMGMQLLIDVLRASGRQEVFHQNLHKLSSYGLGRDVPRLDWQRMLTQMVNQGLLEIDYTDRSTLKLTELSDPVLKGNSKITFTRQEAFKEKIKESRQPKKRDQYQELFFQSLRELRTEIASKEKVPAYMVFSDKVLEEIIKSRPVAIDDLIKVPGIGDYKLRKYGRVLIEKIQSFIVSQDILRTAKGKSHLETLQLWREGYTPEEIAKEKELKPPTIYGHLALLYEKGESIDITQYLNETEKESIKLAWEKSNYSEEIKEISQHLAKEMPLHKIHLGLALMRRG